MKCLISAFVVMFTFEISSADEVNLEIVKILQAKTDQELRETSFLLEEAQKNARDCKDSLSAKELPVACYRQMEIETRLGLVSLLEKNQKLRWLDENCKKSCHSGNFRQLKTIPLELSISCQHDLRLALCKRNYRRGLMNVDSINCLNR